MITNQKALYKEVIENYHNCSCKMEHLSDTWTHILAQKKDLFSFYEMSHMRTPGNRVNSFMLNSSFLVDKILLNLNDPITVQLLEMGESDVGHPRKDTEILGKCFSSLYLVDIFHATKIINKIEALGIQNPRVMDIGGGAGVLLSILKKYFKDRIAIYAVDIPETLLIQEWYLRNCFPEVLCSYKHCEDDTHFIEGGFNFINSHFLNSQSLTFDVVSSSLSLQELPEKTVKDYLTFIQENIDEDGIFYFSNRYGLGTDCIDEPSEYPLDEHWSIDMAQLYSPLVICVNISGLGLLYQRTKYNVDPLMRRLVLRLLWNGFNSGWIHNEDTVVKELLKLLQKDVNDNFVRKMKEILEKHQLPLGMLTSLENSKYFDSKFYFDQRLMTVNPSNVSSQEEFFNALNVSVEVNIIRQMLDVADNLYDVTIQDAQRKVQSICDQVDSHQKEISSSEYWSTKYAGRMFSLGDNQKAMDMINACTDHSKHQRWILRMVQLCLTYSEFRRAQGLMLRVSKENSNPLVLLKRIELLNSLGNKEEAANDLQSILDIYKNEFFTVIEIAKTAARTGNHELLGKTMVLLSKTSSSKTNVPLFQILSLTESNFSKEEILGLIGQYYDSDSKEESRLEYGLLMFMLNETKKGMRIIEEFKKTHHDNYFCLGRMGSALLKYGYEELADNFLKCSLALRQDEFKHYLFLGNAYFEARRFDEAIKYLSHALRERPYLRSLRAKVIYCTLAEHIQKAKVFGDASEINNFFDQSQDFYQDSPNWK